MSGSYCVRFADFRGLSLNTECGGGVNAVRRKTSRCFFFSRRLSTSRLIVPLFLDYSRYVFGLCVRAMRAQAEGTVRPIDIE